MNVESKRNQNQRDFGNWEELANGFRKYWFEVAGRNDGIARYLKVVNEEEVTISFIQEIYDLDGKME